MRTAIYLAYISAMDNIMFLDEATADLFALDPQTGPADDLARYAESDDCTNNGCTKSCQGCDN